MNTDPLDRWLFACPTLRGVSPLAGDAHRSGLLDLRKSLASAVAANVRETVAGFSRTAPSKRLHEQTARAHSARPGRIRLRVESGVGRLYGRCGALAGISEADGAAVLHFRAALPDSLLAALHGRHVASLVHLPILAARNLVITETRKDQWGLTVWFNVPGRPVAIEDLLEI